MQELKLPHTPGTSMRRFLGD
jgi:dynein heavy chain